MEQKFYTSENRMEQKFYTTENNMDNDTKKILEFREILRKIKLSVLNNITYQNQNTESLNKVTKQLIKFYSLLKPVIYEYKSINTIPIPEIRTLFNETLQQYPRSSYYQNQLEYYLKRDFIDFPFTIDEESIDSFPITDHYDKPDIIDNNSSLTE